MRTAVDLFAGAGGLSLGFEQAGYSIVNAVEIDTWAAETYEKNREKCNITQADIKDLPDSFFKQFNGIDIVMGGPPCQGFSIAASNRRNENDPRNYLYRHFLRAVDVIKPRVVLIENVSQIATAKLPSGEKIIVDIYNILSKHGYEVAHVILNAVDFGVPQERVRCFIIACETNCANTFDLHALKYTSKSKLTLWDAISDLPAVNPNCCNEQDIFEYRSPPRNNYQAELRGMQSRVYNHIPMRHTARTIERFKHITLDPKQNAIPKEFLSRERGNSKNISNVIYEQNHRRLNPEKASSTITASFYSSFIHPFEHRNLTVREAARLQSFPDSYIFYGKRTTLSKKLLAKKGIYEDIHLDQFNQVGNSVPPILARTIAYFIDDILKGSK